jgi:hypothetical protein
MIRCFSFYSEGMHQHIIRTAAGLGLQLWVGDLIEETFLPIDGRWDPRRGRVKGPIGINSAARLARRHFLFGFTRPDSLFSQEHLMYSPRIIGWWPCGEITLEVPRAELSLVQARLLSAFVALRRRLTRKLKYHPPSRTWVLPGLFQEWAVRYQSYLEQERELLRRNREIARERGRIRG